jgi:transposase
MPAQYVKPYVKTNKNDYIDAEAIAEAVGRPNMRFVPIKTNDQLDLQSLHRVRERWVVRRTAVINQIRGLLLERGITIRKGRHHIEVSLPGILEDPENKLSGALRVLLAQLQFEMQYLHRQIEESDKLILRIAGELEACRRLVAIPGIGPLTATATIAAIGNGAAFKKGRGFAAWLGVVPGEHSTGGKQKLTGWFRQLDLAPFDDLIWPHLFRPVFREEFIHPRSRRGGGNVVIVATISKICGKSGKTASSFFHSFHRSSFPRPRGLNGRCRLFMSWPPSSPVFCGNGTIRLRSR